MEQKQAKASKSQQKPANGTPPMQEPIERSSRHWAAKAVVQRDHRSLTAQGNSRRGSSTWVRQDCNISRKHHGGALASRDRRRPKKHFSFLQLYIPQATYGKAIIVLGAYGTSQHTVPSSYVGRADVGTLVWVTMVGLHMILYDSHRYSNWSLNSLLLSYVKWWHRGYLHNQVLFTNLAIHSEVLSKISWAINSSLSLTVCQCSCSTTGNSAISNQPEAGLIMVRAIKSICELSLPLRVYGPMRSTHKHSQGIV